MLKKIIKLLLGNSHSHRGRKHYSSSDYKKYKKNYSSHQQYGHGHYRKPHRKSSVFSSFFSS